MIDFQEMRKYISSSSLFDWFQGSAGEFYLFHFGTFVCSCTNTFELQKAQESILRRRVKY